MTEFALLEQITPGTDLAIDDWLLVRDASDATPRHEKRMTVEDFIVGLNALGVGSGSVGPAGPPGAAGATGATGPQGPIGPTGATGSGTVDTDALHHNVGKALGSTLIGGTVTADRLLLKANSAAGTTGTGVGIFGGPTETVRVRGDGHVVIGDDPAFAANNVMLTVRNGERPPQSVIQAGTTLAVLGDNAGAPASGGEALHVEFNVTTDGVFPAGSILSTVVNAPTATFTNINAASILAFAYTDTASAYNLFGFNCVARIFPGIGNKILNPSVPDPPHLAPLEIDLRDDSDGCADDDVYFNTGSVLVLKNMGNADNAAALMISSGEPSLGGGFLQSAAGTVRNGIVISTNAKSYKVWVADEVDGSPPARVKLNVGDVRKVGTALYQCIKSHYAGSAVSVGNGGDGNSHLTPPGNTADWRAYVGGARDHGVIDHAFWFGALGTNHLHTGFPRFAIDKSGNVKQLGDIQFLSTVGPKVIAGTGDPNTNPVAVARVGSIYLRTDGAVGGTPPSFYVKQSGTGNSGWVAK